MKHLPCPSCDRDEFGIKSGLNRTGSQRSRCQACRRYFTPEPKPEGYAMTLRQQALQLYLEGTSLRAIGRLLGVHHQSVSNWVRQAAATLPATVTDQTPVTTIELDELYTYVQRKKTRAAKPA
jgi:transposase-like protein